MAIIFVLLLTVFFTFSNVSLPSFVKGMNLILIFLILAILNHGKTLLACSASVINISSS